MSWLYDEEGLGAGRGLPARGGKLEGQARPGLRSLERRQRAAQGAVNPADIAKKRAQAQARAAATATRQAPRAGATGIRQAATATRQAPRVATTSTRALPAATPGKAPPQGRPSPWKPSGQRVALPARLGQGGAPRSTPGSGLLAGLLDDAGIGSNPLERIQTLQTGVTDGYVLDEGDGPAPAPDPTSDDAGYVPNATVWVAQREVPLMTGFAPGGGGQQLVYPDGTPAMARYWLPRADMAPTFSPADYAPNDRRQHLVPNRSEHEGYLRGWIPPNASSSGLWEWVADWECGDFGACKGEFPLFYSEKQAPGGELYDRHPSDPQLKIFRWPNHRARVSYDMNACKTLCDWDGHKEEIYWFPADFNWYDADPTSQGFAWLSMNLFDDAGMTWSVMPADIYRADGLPITSGGPPGTLPGRAWLDLNFLNAVYSPDPKINHGLPRLILPDGRLDLARFAAWTGALTDTGWQEATRLPAGAMLAIVYDEAPSAGASPRGGGGPTTPELQRQRDRQDEQERQRKAQLSQQQELERQKQIEKETLRQLEEQLRLEEEVRQFDAQQKALEQQRQFDAQQSELEQQWRLVEQELAYQAALEQAYPQPEYYPEYYSDGLAPVGNEELRFIYETAEMTEAEFELLELWDVYVSQVGDTATVEEFLELVGIA